MFGLHFENESMTLRKLVGTTMNKLCVVIMSFLLFCCVWMERAWSDTAVMTKSSLVSVNHKPPEDTIILNLTGIPIYQLCLAECNKHENCNTIVFQEGAGCTLYSSSSLTEPLALGEEAASVTTRDMMYRPDPPYVFENLVIVTGMPGSSCSSQSIYQSSSTYTCDKATDGDGSTAAYTDISTNTNKWYQFNFPEHGIHMIHTQQVCDHDWRCAELRLELGDRIFTMTHNCDQPCETFDKFYVPGYEVVTSSLLIVCTVPCDQIGGGLIFGFWNVRAFAIMEG